LECLLGLVERKKRVVFCYLRDRIWKEKISIGEGSIYQRLARRFSSNLWSKAIPSYFMSVSFLLPSTLQDDLQKIMNSFWWGSNKNTDKDINWLSWDLLSIKKENEGMGFQHLYAFNLAMLWKLVSYSTLLENMLSTSVIYDFQHRFFNRCWKYRRW